MGSNKKLLYSIFFLAVAVGTLFVVTQIKKTPNTRTKAAGSTTISLIPATSSKQVGDNIDLDMMLNPGSNLISFIKFQVQFESSKIQLATDPFTINTTAFPVKVEGPIIGSGTLGESVSIGADATKVIQQPVKIGTLHFKAVGPTGLVSTSVTFTNLTQALSAGGQDGYRTNVLSSTNPASISIGGNALITPGTSPGTTQGPTPTGPAQTTLSVDLLLHGIGSGGDNPNPQGNSLSNKSPLHPQRQMLIEILDSSNQPVASTSGKVNFDSGSGSFKGSILLNSKITEGFYALRVRTPGYLRKLVPGAQKITPLKDNKITQVSLVAADTNGDNALDILDYNAFLDCGYGVLNPLPIDDANSIFNKKNCQNHKPADNIDVNDDGIVDSIDYNLFLRELSVTNGV